MEGPFINIYGLLIDLDVIDFMLEQLTLDDIIGRMTWPNEIFMVIS